MKTVLTEKEKKWIKRLNHGYFTATNMEKHLNSEASIFWDLEGGFLKAYAQGFYEAVKCLAKLNGKGENYGN